MASTDSAPCQSSCRPIFSRQGRTTGRLTLCLIASPPPTPPRPADRHGNRSVGRGKNTDCAFGRAGDEIPHQHPFANASPALSHAVRLRSSALRRTRRRGLRADRVLTTDGDGVVHWAADARLLSRCAAELSSSRLNPALLCTAIGISYRAARPALRSCTLANRNPCSCVGSSTSKWVPDSSRSTNARNPAGSVRSPGQR